MQTQQTSSRKGFTLIEMMCVVGVIVIAAAISVPIIQTTLDDARVNASGDVISGKMAEARARAMEDGQRWKFGFVANTGTYQLAPEDSDVWGTVSDTPDEQAELIRDSLPQDVIFALSREAILGGGAGGGGGGAWETAAIFCPDGSAVDDTIVYFGKAGFSPQRAKLRALTGTVSIETFTGDTGVQP